MELQEVSSSPVEVCYSVKFDEKEVKDMYRKALGEVRKAARVKGFRPGRAPESLLKRLYGEDILRRLINIIVTDASNEVVKRMNESGKNWILGPLLEDFSGDLKDINAFLSSVDEKKSLEMKIVLEVKPDLEPQGYKGMVIKKEDVEIKDEDVERSIDRLRENFAEVVDLQEERPIEEGDVVTVSGRIMKGGEDFEEVRDVSFVVGRLFFYKGVEGGVDTMRFVGHRLGDMIDVDFVGVNGEKTGYTLRVMVKDIKERKLPELDEEFFKKLGVKSLDELKAKVREEMENLKKNAERDRVLREIKEKLVEENKVQVPRRFLERYVERIAGERVRLLVNLGIPEDKAKEEVEKEKDKIREEAERDIAFAFIVEKIAEIEGIDVSREEMVEKLRERLGGAGVSEEDIKDYFDKNPVRMEGLKAALLEEKVLNFIIENSREG